MCVHVACWYIMYVCVCVGICMQVTVAGMEVLVLIVDRMKDKFRPHIGTSKHTLPLSSLPSLSLPPNHQSLSLSQYSQLFVKDSEMLRNR